MFKNILGLVFSQVFAAEGRGKCNSTGIPDIKPVFLLDSTTTKYLMSYLPLIWHKSRGKKKVLVFASISPTKYSYNKLIVSVLYKDFGKEYDIGLFFSDLPDPDKPLTYCSKAAVFLSKSSSIDDFLNLNRLTCKDVSENKYARNVEEIREREETFYKYIESLFYKIAFPLVILEDGRVYDFGLYSLCKPQEVLYEILKEK